MSMFLGKGGVGKTTIAGIAAVKYASKEKTLIISTDPAPSLSDLFEEKIGPRETMITDNLYALELNSEEIFTKWRKKFGQEIYDVFSAFFDIDYTFIDYVGTAPGIDEEYMLDYIYGIYQSNKYDKIVWDTAPSGHTLRLLHLPLKFIEHLRGAPKIYMSIVDQMEKFKGLTLKEKRKNVVEIIEGWKNLSAKIINFMQNCVCYSIITIPEALGVHQTKHILKEFENFGMKAKNVLINFVIENPDCEFHIKR